MPTPQNTRTARVEARIAPESLAVVRRAAELQGRSISDFMVAAALKDARQTIEDDQIIRLSVEDQLLFAQTLLNPPALVPAMQRALDARKRLIEANGVKGQRRNRLPTLSASLPKKASTVSR